MPVNSESPWEHVRDNDLGQRRVIAHMACGMRSRRLPAIDLRDRVKVNDADACLRSFANYAIILLICPYSIDHPLPARYRHTRRRTETMGMAARIRSRGISLGVSGVSLEMVAALEGSVA